MTEGSSAAHSAVDDLCDGLQIVLFDGGFGGQDHPGGAIGDLRMLPGSDFAIGTFEGGFQFGQTGHGIVAAHTIVKVIDLGRLVPIIGSISSSQP